MKTGFKIFIALILFIYFFNNCLAQQQIASTQIDGKLYTIQQDVNQFNISSRVYTDMFNYISGVSPNKDSIIKPVSVLSIPVFTEEDFCCLRTIIVAPIEMPSEQEWNSSYFLGIQIEKGTKHQL